MTDNERLAAMFRAAIPAIETKNKLIELLVALKNEQEQDIQVFNQIRYRIDVRSGAMSLIERCLKPKEES